MPSPCASSARKRRIQAIREATSKKQKVHPENSSTDDPGSTIDNSQLVVPKCVDYVLPAGLPSTSPREQTAKNAPRQNTYEPDVPMTKEELKAWRKEQRRVRNRESAALSRKKTRDRIFELEQEVGQWKAKYAIAIERIARLESSTRPQSAQSHFSLQQEVITGENTWVVPTTDLTTESDMPKSVRNDHPGAVVSPSASPPPSPKSSPRLVQLPLVISHRDQEIVEEKPHLIETISRPA